MLYLLYGNDRERAREKLNAVLAVLSASTPGAPICRMSAEDLSAANLRELLGSRGLFSPARIVVLEDALAEKETVGVLLGNLGSFAESEHSFFVLEGELHAEILSQIKKHTRTIEAFLKKEEKKKPPFSLFLVADVLGRRDRKTLWVNYQQALRSGLSPEEIHTVLFWKVKTMILAQQAGSAETSGLSPFVFRRASADARRFTTEELRALSARFVRLYHEARRGSIEIETGLEKTILCL